MGQSGQNYGANAPKTMGQICKGQVIHNPLYDPLQEHLHLSMDHLDYFTPQTEHGPLGTKVQSGPYQERKKYPQGTKNIHFRRVRRCHALPGFSSSKVQITKMFFLVVPIDHYH